MDAAAAMEDNGGAAEGPWALPEGWCWISLGEVLSPVSTTDPKRSLGQQTFNYIDLSALEDGRVTDAQLIVGNEAPSRARQMVQTGDTLFSCVRVYLQNIALLGDGLSNPIASTAYCVMRPSAAINPRYLNYFVRSRRFIEWMIPLQRGNSPPAVLDGDLKAQLFPLAPLAEQRRIVARVDAMFAEIAEGEAALAEARKGLDIFRRALLKAAVTGELTRDWRAANRPSETSDKILARLRKRYPNASPTRAGWEPKSDLPLLPEGWAWCAIEEAGEVQLGRQRAPQHHDGDHMRPYLRVANVLEDRLDLSDVKSMNFTPAEFETFALQPGDILLNEGQAPDLLGRPAMYQGEITECCFQKTLLRFRAKKGVLPDYALIVFRYYMRSGRFKRESRITTNIGHLTQVRFVVMEFPLPSEAEQRAIVELFREDEAAVADVLTVLDAEAADSARLRQSILKAAFEGHLASQDPADEPASALLARLVETTAVRRVKRGAK